MVPVSHPLGRVIFRCMGWLEDASAWLGRFVVLSPCFDCGIDVMKSGHWYIVHDHVWAVTGVGKGFLCIDCLERRLARRLTRDDFTDAPVNDWLTS